MQSNNFLTITAIALASAAIAPVAHAHINMVGDFLARDGDQKAVPCDGKRGDGPIYELEPGSTITLTVNETVGHPSYYRVAFDADGEDFVDPRSIKVIEKYSRKCPYDSTDQCGEADFCNNTADGQLVLWDNLDEHIRGILERSTSKWNIKLPDVECDNCTIQVIQVMQDADLHGGYCPLDIDKCDTPDAIPDNYHRCIDIKLVKGAKKIPGVTTDAVSNKGKECLADVVTPTDPEKDAGTPPDEPGTVEPGSKDASTGSSSRDAGADDAEDDGETDEPEEGSSSGSVKTDAGTVKKDAGKSTSGTKKDAGSDDEPQSSGGGDSGCAVATGSSEGAAWSLLALGWLLARRRRVPKAS